jgi:hypothetical protein
MMATLASWTIVFPATWAMAIAHASTIAGDGTILGSSRSVVLNPDAWLGGRLPLVQWIQGIGPELSTGKWLVVLHSNDCPRCQSLIQSIIDCINAEDRVADIRFAIVAVGTSDALASPDSGGARFGHLDLRKDWSVDLPLAISVDDGRVMAVARDDATILLAVEQVAP